MAEETKKIKVSKPRKKPASGMIKVKRVKKAAPAPVENVIDLSVATTPPLYEEPVVRQTIEEKIHDSSRWPFALYRRIAVTFIILAIVALGAVAYISLVKVDIAVTPKVSSVQAETVFSVYDRPENYSLPETSILGMVRAMDVEYTQESPASGKKVIGAEVSGTVTVINNYTKDQPLVATTRLLTPDGQLLRLRDSIVVPAGGQMQATVYADGIDDPSFTLADARLTIPGLWAGLQDKIYAEAKAGDVSYQEKAELSITQADIDEAVRRGKAALLDKAKNEINSAYASYNQKLYQLDDSSVSFTVKGSVGDKQDSVTVDLKASVVVVAFNDDKVRTMTSTALMAAANGQASVVDDKAATPAYRLVKADTSQNIAEVAIEASAPSSVKEASALVDRAKILSLSRDQLDAYLKSLPNIESYQATFTPSFWPWTPQLVDRITVRLK